MKISNPSLLVAELKAEGFTLTAEGGRLRVAPARLLTDELRESIRQHRAALLSLVENQALQTAPAVRVGIDSTQPKKIEKKPVSAPAMGTVTCGSCLNYQANAENPARGLGRCALTLTGLPPAGGSGYRAPYPFSSRICPHFVAREETPL